MSDRPGESTLQKKVSKIFIRRTTPGRTLNASFGQVFHCENISMGQSPTKCIYYGKTIHMPNIILNIRFRRDRCLKKTKFISMLATRRPRPGKYVKERGFTLLIQPILEWNASLLKLNW